MELHAHAHEAEEIEARQLPVHDGDVAADQADPLEAADPRMGRRRREVDPAGEVEKPPEEISQHVKPSLQES